MPPRRRPRSTPPSPREDDAPIAALAEAIRHLHGVNATYLDSVEVDERHEGRPVWQGAVKVFAVDHPSGAKRAYAWSYETENGKRRFTAVLGLGPVVDAVSAVRMAVAAEFKKAQN